MSMTDRIRSWLWQVMTPPDDWGERRAMLEDYARWRDYYDGIQRRQIKVKAGQADDNIVLNFSSLVVERSVSMLFGNGVEFDLPGEAEDPNSAYIDAVWKANKKDILLHKVGQNGSIYGTCYVKIVPDGVEAREAENAYLPRLINLDPMTVSVQTDPEDIDTVIGYEIRYVVMMDGQETARREVIEPVYSAITDDEGRLVGNGGIVGWTIANYKSNSMTGGRWVEMYEPQEWPYEFPPIMHWQNLPQAGNVYGLSEIANILELQDRINFTASNVSKIIRYHAHPRTWGRNISAGGKSTMNWGADEMPVFSGDGAQIANLEMQSDLSSSRGYMMELRQALFDISRTVDVTSLADKLGALTNFGLRVLFLDAMAKISTKQEIYGEALSEINHRLLVIGGIDPVDGGDVIWPDTLPQNEIEAMQSDGFDLERGIASKQTIAQRRGYEWEDEKERMGEEQAAGDNVGAAILRAFSGGNQ